MGRCLQAIGLLLMIVGFTGVGLLRSGNAQFVALADPCVPNTITNASVPKGALTNTSTAPATTATPPGQPAISSRLPFATLPPSTPVPAPTATSRQPQPPTSYPVFAPSEDLTAPSPEPTTSPTPVPAATPSLPPCPSNHHHLFGNGPIEFSGNGTMDLGTHRTTSQQESEAQNDLGASMQLSVTRRTDQTALVVSDILGAQTGVYNVGQINIGYSTPLYSLGYGVVNGPGDTQLSNGTFDRGVTLGVPHGRDELDFMGAHTTGVNGEGYRVGGIRHSRTYPKGLLVSESLYYARGDQSAGSDLTLDTSVGKYTAGETLRAEFAVTHAHGVPTVADGTRLALAVFGNFVGLRTSTGVGYTTIPDGYLALGQVQYGQRQWTFTNRRPWIGSGVMTFDFGDLTTDQSGTESRAVHDTFNFGSQIAHFINSQLLVNFAKTSSSADTTFERDFGLTLNEQLHGFSLSQTAQSSAITGDLVGDATTQSQYAFTFSHPFFGGYFSADSSVARATGTGALTQQFENTATFTRAIGRKAEFSINADTLRSTTSGGLTTNPTSQFTTTYSLMRKFSPVVGLRATYGKTHQNGAFGGTAGYFNIDVVGPIALGTAAQYTGRINPNLPSVIQGHVYLVDQGSYGFQGNRGLPNILITLDGGVTQRTDSTGSYEFRFIRPGIHTISMSPGTLPPGVIPDTTTQSVTIQGGQLVNVDFAAGQFAGVGGKVMERVGGSMVPVPNVLLTVDNSQRGYTGTDGSYEIGHLTNGTHTVAIATDSLPADLAVSSTTSKVVQVVQGSVAGVDWVLSGLGSIEGEVLYTTDSGFGDLTGARDVYVVADPGEHAAITDGEGHFIIDNLPPGDYTLSLDQDTIPDGQTVLQGPDGPVTVTGDVPTSGITFKLGAAAKQVILTFGGGSSAVVNANFEPDKAPPNSLVDLVVQTDQKDAKSVVAEGDVLGNYRLHYDAQRKAWVTHVPVGGLANGDYNEHVTVKGAHTGTGDASLTVSNVIPLIYARGTPDNPKPGQIVHVTAKILAHVEPGDSIFFEDGQTVTLPEPQGHIYGFTLRVRHALPYRAMLVTRRGVRLPFVIGP